MLTASDPVSWGSCTILLQFVNFIFSALLVWDGCWWTCWVKRVLEVVTIMERQFHDLCTFTWSPLANPCEPKGNPNTSNLNFLPCKSVCCLALPFSLQLIGTKHKLSTTYNFQNSLDQSSPPTTLWHGRQGTFGFFRKVTGKFCSLLPEIQKSSPK